MSKIKCNTLENVAGTKSILVDDIVNGGIGVNQVWVDETANRVVGTTYTNTTGKPIMIWVTITAAALSSGEALPTTT